MSYTFIPLRRLTIRFQAKVALDTMATENTTYDENVRTIKAQVQETQVATPILTLN